MVKFILIKSPDEWATTKQACRDELVVYLFFSFHIYIYIYIYIHIHTCGEFCVLIGYPSGQGGVILNFFLTTDTTDTTIWKPGFKLHIV